MKVEVGKMRRGNLTEEGKRRPMQKETGGGWTIAPMVFD